MIFENKFIKILNISRPFYRKQCKMHFLPLNERLRKNKKEEYLICKTPLLS
jgi:hypothetical protein